MKDEIKTIEEAIATTYGYGMYKRPYTEGNCADRVWESGRGAGSYQCHHKNGHGIGGLYCKIHAKKHPSEAEISNRFKVFKVTLNEQPIIKEFDCIKITNFRVIVVAGKGMKGIIDEPKEFSGLFGWKYFEDKNEAIQYAKESLKNKIVIAERSLVASKLKLENFLQEYPDSDETR